MITLLSLLVLASPAEARSTGITGRSTSGCGGAGCHGTMPATTTTATLAATSTTLAPGASTAVTLRVVNTNATRTHAGLNAAASGGTLGAGSNTVKSGTQITHSAPQALTAGSITFRFRWTAPATAGTYNITAAANAVNFNGANTGDGWKVATALPITVSSAFAPEDASADDGTIEDGETEVVYDLDAELTPDELAAIHAWADAGGYAGEAADEPADEPSDELDLASGPGEDEAVDFSGCATTGSTGSVGLLALAGLAGLAARRRR